MILVQCDQPTGYVSNFDDCDDTDAAINPNTVWYTDFDGDGFGNPNSTVTACDPGSGYVLNGDDCDDQIAAVNPNASEVCNGVDDNCDGNVDEGLSPDVDGDGYTAIGSCGGSADDCDDNNANVNPGATEIPCNGIDDDCDPATPDGGTGSTWYADNDGDGYGDPDDSISSCSQPSGYVADNADCDDTNANINPGMTELCWNNIDDDCDGFVDNNSDDDGDGVTVCQGDCDDTDPLVNPYAYEFCDGIDNNCNGIVDEGTDHDNDGWSTCDGDCNDWNAAINPAATEVCNNKDDDCDGYVDEGVQTTYYSDWDGDGYGDPNVTQQNCTQPNNFVANADDCNDNAININPAATEVCDGFDNNCDGNVDEGFDVDGDGFETCQGDCDDNDPTVNPGVNEICDGIDNDCDGYVDEGFDNDNDGWTTCEGDCHDWNPNIYPGAPEICDWKDNDCNGLIDDGIGDFWYLDADWDGYGDPNDVVQSCWTQWGRVTNGDDCDDSKGNVNPGATEVCDGLDNDCDGIIDNVDNGPDLIVESANAPATAEEGETINVSGVIKNIGNQNAGTNRIYWWLSDDEYIDGSDYRLNSWRRWTNNINAGATKNFSKNITLPSSGWTGNKYLVFRADAQYHVNEGCENNNRKAIPISITNNFGGGGWDESLGLIAQQHGPETALHWFARFEQEVKGMAIERSDNGIDFQMIMDMPNEHIAVGDHGIFEKWDRLPMEGANHYRVKFDMADGSTTYTEIRLVNYENLDPFDVIPNPVSTFMNIRMKRFMDKQVDVVLFDRFAREIHRVPIEKVEKEWLQLDLHDPKYKDGLYVLSVIHQGRAISKRIVITK